MRDAKLPRPVDARQMQRPVSPDDARFWIGPGTPVTAELFCPEHPDEPVMATYALGAAIAFAHDLSAGKLRHWCGSVLSQAKIS